MQNTQRACRGAMRRDANGRARPFAHGAKGHAKEALSAPRQIYYRHLALQTLANIPEKDRLSKPGIRFDTLHIFVTCCATVFV
jgi:hypothetical protein